eukprot:g6411.t1
MALPPLKDGPLWFELQKNSKVAAASMRAGDRRKKKLSKAERHLLKEKPWLRQSQLQKSNDLKPTKWFKTWESGYYSDRYRPRGLADMMKQVERKAGRDGRWQTRRPLPSGQLKPSKRLNKYESLLQKMDIIETRMRKSEDELGLSHRTSRTDCSAEGEFSDNVSSALTTPRSLFSQITESPESMGISHTPEVRRAPLTQVSSAPRFFAENPEEDALLHQNSNDSGRDSPLSPKMRGGPKSKARKEKRRKERFSRQQHRLRRALEKSTYSFERGTIESGPWEADPEDNYNSAGVDAFLGSFKQKAHMVPSARKVQALFRQIKPRVRYMKWKKNKLRKLSIWMTAWKLSFQARKLDRTMNKRRFFKKWQRRIEEILTEREMSRHMFANLDAPGGGTAQIFKFMDAGTKSNRVRSAEEIRKEQRLKDNIIGAMKMKYWRRWTFYLRLKKRSRADAGLCLKRCMKTFSTLMRPMWVGERVALMFRMWYRYTKLKKCERTDAPLPRFEQNLPFWNAWLTRYQAQQRRSLHAQVRGPMSLKLRLFRRWQLFSAYQVDKRRKKALANAWAKESLKLSYFRKWAKQARGRGSRFRLLRIIMSSWHEWAAHQAWRKRNIAQMQAKLNHILLEKVFFHMRKAISDSQKVTTHGIYALLDPDNAQLAMLCVRAWQKENVRFLFLRIWKQWRRLVHTRWSWKNVLFVYRRCMARDIMKRCFIGWKTFMNSKASENYENLSDSSDEDRNDNDAPMTQLIVNQMDRIIEDGDAPEDSTDLKHLCQRLIDPKYTNGALARLLQKQENHVIDHLGNTKLHAAASKGDDSETKSLLLQGASPHIRNHEGDTPLHLVASRYNMSFVLTTMHLLKCGAPVGAKNKAGLTAAAIAPAPFCIKYLLKSHEERIHNGEYTWAELRDFRQMLLDQRCDMSYRLFWRYVSRRLMMVSQAASAASESYKPKGWNLCKMMAENFLKGENSADGVGINFELLIERLYKQVLKRYEKRQEMDQRDTLLLRRYELRRAKEDWEATKPKQRDDSAFIMAESLQVSSKNDQESDNDTVRLLAGSGASDVNESDGERYSDESDEGKRDAAGAKRTNSMSTKSTNAKSNGEEKNIDKSLSDAETANSIISDPGAAMEVESSDTEDEEIIIGCRHYGKPRRLKTVKDVQNLIVTHKWTEEERRQEILMEGIPETKKEWMKMMRFWRNELARYTEGSQLLWVECDAADAAAEVLSEEVAEQKKDLQHLIQDVLDMKEEQKDSGDKLASAQQKYAKDIENQRNKKEETLQELAEVSAGLPELHESVKELNQAQDECSKEFMRLGHLLARNPDNEDLLEEQNALEARVQVVMKDLYRFENERDVKEEDIANVEAKLRALDEEVELTRSDYKASVSDLIHEMQTRTIQKQKLKQEIRKTRKGLKQLAAKVDETYLRKRELVDELHVHEELLAKSEAIIAKLEEIEIGYVEEEEEKEEGYLRSSSSFRSDTILDDDDNGNVEPPKDYVKHIKTLQEEARKGLRATSGDALDAELKIKHLFNQIDEDHSGTLTKKE